MLEIAARAGAGTADERVAYLAGCLCGLAGPAGLWEHPTHPELCRWLSFELRRGLDRLAGGDWAGAALRPGRT